jgi:hypothetical protein
MKTELFTKVDALGALLAQIDSLTKQADELKDEIKNAGEGAHDGALFRATVSLYQRNAVDYKALLKRLNVPEWMVAEHSKTTAVLSLKVTSR